jgi:hypothetical protein
LRWSLATRVVLDASVCALMLLMLRLDVLMTFQEEENADENNSGASE